jgi:hypothetical protein
LGNQTAFFYGFKVQGSKVQGSGFKVQGSMVQGSAPPLAKQTAGQLEKETLKKRITNIEQGITNIEVRYSIINIFKKTERSDSTLHHSKFGVRYSAVRF